MALGRHRIQCGEMLFRGRIVRRLFKYALECFPRFLVLPLVHQRYAEVGPGGNVGWVRRQRDAEVTFGAPRVAQDRVCGSEVGLESNELRDLTSLGAGQRAALIQGVIESAQVW